MNHQPAPRKFIFDTSDKNTVLYNNGYYTLNFPSPIQCTKISVLECTLLHSFYNVDYYNNEILLKIPALHYKEKPFELKIYLTPGFYKNINDILQELVSKMKLAINNPSVTNNPNINGGVNLFVGLPSFKEANIKVILNEKTYRLTFEILDFLPTIYLTFTNSYRLFGFPQIDNPNLSHLDLNAGSIYTSPFMSDIVHNPAIYFRSPDLHTHCIYNAHTTNIFFRMPVNETFLKWMHYTNTSPECTYFLQNGSLNQLTIRVTDYLGLDVFLNGGDFKIEFIVS